LWRLQPRKLAERAGFERAQTTTVVTASSEYREVAHQATPATDVEIALNEGGLDRFLDHSAGEPGRDDDPVEAALARALDRASEAGRFDVVVQLARELEARRLARSGNVIRLEDEREKRGT
jgi:hypothetical protein